MKKLLYLMRFIGSLILGLFINYQLQLVNRIPNFWLLGPAADMAYIGIGLMLGCLIYVLVGSAIPKEATTFKERLERNFLYAFMATYGVLLFFILFVRDLGGGSLELVPFRGIMGTISWMIRGQLNLPFGFALLIGNVMLFVPLAYFLRPYFTGAWCCYGALLGIFIVLELLQFVTDRGAFDIDDLIKYSLGVPIGFWLRRFWHKK